MNISKGVYMSFLRLHSKNIGIDLGTASILVVLEGKGICINEPAIVAVRQKQQTVLAIGHEAKEMIGRTPNEIRPLSPLQHAGISDLKAAEMIVKNVIKRLERTEEIGMPKIVINVHVGMTEVEKRAVLKLIYDVGAREAYLVEEPIAAALGANLDVYSPEGTMVVDIGAGMTEVAVMALGKIVSSDALRIAGDDLDQNIMDYIKKNLKVEIGKNAAERIKIEIASAKPRVNQKITIKGRDLRRGLPREITIDAFQVYEAIRGSLFKMIDVIKGTLDRTPPELIMNVQRTGITLTGGTAYIDGLDKLISERLRIKVNVPENPLECVALGIGKVIESSEKMKELKSKKKVK